MWCAACRVHYTEKRPHPAGAHCDVCLHPFNTIAPNEITRSRHYQGCPKVDQAHQVLSRAAQSKHAIRHRQQIEDRQKGVYMPPKRTSLDGPPPTAEYAHWSGCSDPDCQRCNEFEQVIDLGYDQLTGA